MGEAKKIAAMEGEDPSMVRWKCQWDLLKIHVSLW